MASTNHFTCEVVECSICLVSIDTNKNHVTTECGHQFHTTCLLSNVAYNGFGCPYCRSEMVDESVSKHMHEEDDDDDDTDFDEDDDDDEDQEQQESDVLRGFRFMLERVTGEVLTNEDDVVEENEYLNEDVDDDSENHRPSVALISKKLSEDGVTIETFVKALLVDHEEYNDERVEEFYEINDGIFDKIRDIINNYSPQQEEELEDPSSSIEEISKNLMNVPYQQTNDKVENQEDLNFYFLKNEFIEKCKQNTNIFLLEEELNYYDYSLEEKFINSIISCVF
jgi:hypothetical protein